MPFLLIDKPQGITSHGVVARVRRITGEKRVGHAGTLDPFATGLLIIGVTRESTKHLGELLGRPKTYDAVVRLGATTETFDPEKPEMVDESSAGRTVSATDIDAAIASFVGDIAQIPPMFSAIKVGGQKMYNLARKGQTVDLPPRPVTIYEMRGNTPESATLPFDLPLSCRVSAGTYIRAIARDLGTKMGTTGYLTALRRTAIGDLSIENAVTLEQLTPENWLDFAKDGDYLSIRT